MTQKQNIIPLEAVRHADLRLQTVLNALPVGISWARLKDSHILFMNRKFTDMFGYTVDDFTSVQEWVDKAYPVPEHRERAAASWYKYFGNPTPNEFEIDPVEVDVLCKDGIIKTTILGGVILPETGWALATFVDISARKHDEILIRTLAEEDPLTELPNRRSFDAYLVRAISEALRERHPMHLLIMDLDYFKDVNDTLGHQAGDIVLEEVAKRFRSCVRSGDIVARFGGDEFAIILPNSGNDESVSRICSKIIETIQQPINTFGKNVKIGVSIGIARTPVDGTDADSLFKAADIALYKSKHESRGKWLFYENNE